MDPFSLTIGAIALVGCCHKIVKGLKVLQSLSQIPEDIASLVDELQDLEHVLAIVCTINQHSKQTKHSKANTDKLQLLLLKASNIVSAVAKHCGISIEDEQCRDIVADVTSLSGSPTQRIDLLSKFRWLKDQKRIEVFRERLKIVRSDISNHLASQNLINSHLVLAAFQESSTHTHSVLAEVSAEVKNLQESVRKLSVDHEQLSPKSLKMAIDTDVLPHGYLTDSPADDDMCPTEAPPAYTRHPVSNMSSCSCSCHRVSSFQTPRSTEKWIGQLQIRAGGLPYLAPACDQVLCRQSKHASLATSYRMPAWLSNRVFNTKFKTHKLVGPDLNLFSTRVIDRNSQIFYCAMHNDLAGMKKLFSEGKASPADVSHNYGYSALHYAVDYGHIDMASFLIKQGAKPDLADFDNRTATDLAYGKLVSQAPTKDWDSERVQEIFDEEEWLEQRQMTILHKIVLGIADPSRTLMKELSTSVKEINTGDCEKRTPLSWAAELGDELAIKTLLKFGANMEQACRDGNTPVHYASKCTTGPRALQTLLNAGASPIARNKWQQTPLNWVSFGQNDPRYVECLMFHPEVTLNDDVDVCGSTPVGNAAFSGHGNMLRFLLDNGADPNAGIESGEVPMLDSISRNAHECLRILLSRARQCKLNMSQTDSYGETCLHYLARRADLETTEIFLKAMQNDQIDITGLRTAHVDKEGLTPRNILLLRGDINVESALEQVLSVIDHETLGEMSSVASEEEPYVDAWEIQQDLEKDIGLKSEPLVQVRELAVA